MTRSDSFAPPWIERQKVEDVVEILENVEEDWESLDGEERHGSVVQALDLLREVDGR